MASINVGRVIAGGIVGGIVANACDIVWGLTVMKDDMAGLAQKFGTDPATMNSLGATLPWIAVDFVVGLLIVWTYAAMRPRFGAGPKTAVIAGVTIYVGVTAVLVGFTSMGMMSSGAFVRGALTSLVTTVLASLAGGAVYQEARA